MSHLFAAVGGTPAYFHTVPPDPRRLDPLDDPRAVEEGCLAITEQKKYWHSSTPDSMVFIKRNLTPSEYAFNYAGELLLPYKCLERLKNEAAALKYVKEHTTIPVPNVRCAFEDHGRFYIITDIVTGLRMDELPDDNKALVQEELRDYVDQMHAIKSHTMGGFAGDVILPYRLEEGLPHDYTLKLRKSSTCEFVLCHNDLSQYNVIVDEETFKVKAILDWEYAGFFPPEFDAPFYLRPGPSVPLGDEKCDREQLRAMLEQWKSN